MNARTSIVRSAVKAAALLTGAVGLMAAGAPAARAEDADIFSFLSKALSDPAPVAQQRYEPPSPTRSYGDEGRHNRRRREQIRANVRRERSSEPMAHHAERLTRPRQWSRYASLEPTAPPAIKSFTPLPGGPDFSGAVDPAYVAEERKALASTIAGKVAGGGYLYGRQTMCVRLCDGHAFPVGQLHDLDDLSVHETACRATCPGAATVLFSRPNGEEGMSGATSLGGRPYATLRTAFAYQEKRVPACSCHGEGAQAYTPLPLSQDRTLKAGDILAGRSTLFVLTLGKLAQFADIRGDKRLSKTAQLLLQNDATRSPRSTVRVRIMTPGKDDAPGDPVVPPTPTDGEVRVVLPRPY